MKYLFLIFVLIDFILRVSAQAGTYNFYFNNTEQGDNSTSTPSVVIKDGKKESSEEDTTEESPAVEQKKPPAKSDVETSEDEETSEELLSSRMLFFRIVAGASYQSVTSTRSKSIFEADTNSSLPFWEQKTTEHSEGFGVLVSGSMFFGRYLGVTLNLGSLSSLEGELTPLGLGRGILEPALLFGFTGESLFAGGRISMNFTKSLSITVAGRSDLGLLADDFKFHQIEGGLAYRF